MDRKFKVDFSLSPFYHGMEKANRSNKHMLGCGIRSQWQRWLLQWHCFVMCVGLLLRVRWMWSIALFLRSGVPESIKDKFKEIEDEPPGRCLLP